MAFRQIILHAALATSSAYVHAQSLSLGFCTDGACTENCPSHAITVNNEYPNCAVYGSESMLGGLGFPTADGGGYTAFLDIPQPEFGCQILFRSPASTEVPGCGQVLGQFKNAACKPMSFKETFMLQHCCDDACDDASPTELSTKRSVKRSAKFSSDYLKRSGGGGGGMYLKGRDGNIIQPLEVGTPINMRDLSVQNETSSEPEPREDPTLSTRGRCIKNSWIPDADPYETTGDSTKVAQNVDGGSVTLTTGVSTSWSTTAEAGLSFADIFSLGVSTTMTQESSTSASYRFDNAENLSGDLRFTPYMLCSNGRGQCDDGDYVATICWPETDDSPNKYTLGSYAITETS